MIDLAAFSIAAALCIAYLIRRGVRTRRAARMKRNLKFAVDRFQTDEYGRAYPARRKVGK